MASDTCVYTTNLDALKGKRFVASYSGGKDSILALHRATKQGLIPVGLVTTYNTSAERSWFHGLSLELLQSAADALGLPLMLARTDGSDYEQRFEAVLARAREAGAEVCVFGDIDIDEHISWDIARAEAAGLIPYLPLWQNDRRELVYELIDAGFKSMLTIVNTNYLPEGLLGRILSRELVASIEEHGADICGENGEYHTFTYDGPAFAEPVRFEQLGYVWQGDYAILSLDTDPPSAPKQDGPKPCTTLPTMFDLTPANLGPACPAPARPDLATPDEDAR